MNLLPSGKRFTQLSLPRDITFGYGPKDLSAHLTKCFPTLSPMRIADIGAGSSLHTIELARTFPRATVRAFEPSVDMQILSRENIAISKQKNILFSDIAVEQVCTDYPSHFDLIHTCLIKYFIGSGSSFEKNIISSMAKNSIWICTDFFIPENYSNPLRAVALELMKKIFGFEILNSDQFINTVADLGLKLIDDSAVVKGERANTSISELSKLNDRRRYLLNEICRTKFLPEDFVSLQGAMPLRTFVFVRE